MFRSSTALLLAFLVASLLTPSQLRADEQEKAKLKEKGHYESVWMKRKLRMSQRIMAGLARGDLDEVNHCARTLDSLSRIEGWARRSDTKEYRRELKRFDQATAEMIRQSDNENLHGATLAFTQMTLSCVTCHQHLRDAAPPGPTR